MLFVLRLFFVDSLLMILLLVFLMEKENRHSLLLSNLLALVDPHVLDGLGQVLHAPQSGAAAPH